ncbi:MAG: hypothetical protein FWF67_01075 [Fibromonadales bacterium]|nr:hypothetical protein [Fibromonadales bacterium]
MANNFPKSLEKDLVVEAIFEFEKIISFAEKFIKSQIDLDAESQKILNDNFWDLV